MMYPQARALAMTIAIAGVVSIGACLDPTSGKSGKVTSDVAPDSPSDSSEDTSTDAPDTSVCLDLSCHDGNPCTQNNCHYETGCFYEQMPDYSSCGECSQCIDGACEPIDPPPIRAPECDVDNDCDDGDPCTLDTCDCGTPNTCFSNTCICYHAPVPGCVVPPVAACNGVGAIAIEDAVELSPGTYIKVRGPAGLSPNTACEPEECGDCGGGIALKKFGKSVSLASNSQTLGPDDIWGCTAIGCSTEVQCTPMEAATEYWAWGTIQNSVGGSDPSLDNVLLVVDGWCIATDAPSFAGQYQGTLVHNYGYTSPLTLVVAQKSSGGWAVELSALDCVDCQDGSQPVQQATQVTVEDGAMYFEAKVPDGYNTESSFFSLSVDKHFIQGWFEADYGQSFPGRGAAGADSNSSASKAAIAIPGGNITVERAL